MGEEDAPQPAQANGQEKEAPQPGCGGGGCKKAPKEPKPARSNSGKGGCACTKPSVKEGGPTTKAGVLQLAQKSVHGGIEVVVQEDEIDLPWHAVPTAKEVVEDLASNAESGLSSGARE